MIKLTKLNKNYFNKQILNNVNFQINEKDFVLLIGDNGSGKSTILKLISGLIRPEKKEQIIRDDCVYLAEKFRLSKHIKTYELISLIEKIFYVDLSFYKFYLEIEDKKISELSKGNLQKIGLILVIASKRNFILLDEPTEGMDKSLKLKFITILKKLNKEGKTIVISTHDVKDYKNIKVRKIKVIKGMVSEDE